MRKLWVKQNGAAVQCENSHQCENFAPGAKFRAKISHWCEKFGLVRNFASSVKISHPSAKLIFQLFFFLFLYPASSPSKI